MVILNSTQKYVIEKRRFKRNGEHGMSPAAAAKKKFDGVKAAEIALAVFLVALLAVFFAGYIPFSHPLLTSRVAALLKQSGADTCVLGNVRLALWKGVSMHDLVMAGSFAPDRRYRVRAGTLSFDVNCARAALRRAAIRDSAARESANVISALKTAPAAELQRLFRLSADVAGVKSINADKADARLAYGLRNSIRMSGRSASSRSTACFKTR